MRRWTGVAVKILYVGGSYLRVRVTGQTNIENIVTLYEPTFHADKSDEGRFVIAVLDKDGNPKPEYIGQR